MKPRVNAPKCMVGVFSFSLKAILAQIFPKTFVARPHCCKKHGPRTLLLKPVLQEAKEFAALLSRAT